MMIVNMNVPLTLQTNYTMFTLKMDFHSESKIYILICMS